MIFKGFLGDCDGTCGTTPRPCRVRELPADSVLQDSFVGTGSEEGLTQVGTGSTTEKEKDIESGEIGKAVVDITVDAEYRSRAES